MYQSIIIHYITFNLRSYIIIVYYIVLYHYNNKIYIFISIHIITYSELNSAIRFFPGYIVNRISS